MAAMVTAFLVRIGDQRSFVRVGGWFMCGGERPEELGALLFPLCNAGIIWILTPMTPP